MPRNVAETCIGFDKVKQSIMNGTCDDFDDKMKPLLKIISKEIVKQRKRLGGDFAVAQAVVSRDWSIELSYFIPILLHLLKVNKRILQSYIERCIVKQDEPRLVQGASGQRERDLRRHEPDQELPEEASGGEVTSGNSFVTISRLPDGYSHIFRSYICVWPFGLLDYGSATLRCKI